MRKILPGDPRMLAWHKAHKAAGGTRVLAEHFGISRAAILQWDICPPERVVEVERLSGISRHVLRPDVFGEGATHREQVDQAFAAFGKIKLAKALRLTVEEIDAWPDIPLPLVPRIEKLTGLSKHVLRPDIFGEEAEREVA